ncbi:hypothetical protein AAIH59_33025, partial [Pseudomonas aeruginosa]
MQTYAAVLLHPLFFYCLKLIKTTSQTPFLRRQTQWMLRHLAGKTLRQSLKKLWYPRSGLRRKPDTDRFVL